MWLTCLILLLQPNIEFGPDRNLVSVGPLPAGTQAASVVLQVYVSQACELSSRALPMLGETSWQGDHLQFTPEFWMQRGIQYCARLEIEGQLIACRVFQYPQRALKPSTSVTAIYPSAEVIPANHLRFYISFSASMRQGDAYDHIHLLRSDGSEVTQAFFQDEVELWDPQRRRFTLYLDPSRVKRGLRYRHDLGPVLVEGQRYILRISKAMRDAEGQPLKTVFEKAFVAGSPDYRSPDRAVWRVQFPKTGTREPLEIKFREPLDFALLKSSIILLDSEANPIKGSIQISDSETRWIFTPDQPWTVKPRIEVADRLADSCGNNLQAPFEHTNEQLPKASHH